MKRQDPETYRYSHPHAYKLGQKAAKSDNVEKFLMGRQMFVVFIVFFSAKLTTIHSESQVEMIKMAVSRVDTKSLKSLTIKMHAAFLTIKHEGS